MTQPELIIVGGPNGAGKTTFAEAYITHHDCLYLSADAIAKQLSPNDPTRAQIKAGHVDIPAVWSTFGLCIAHCRTTGR
jgi:predicted ABC-type ATPase